MLHRIRLAVAALVVATLFVIFGTASAAHALGIEDPIVVIGATALTWITVVQVFVIPLLLPSIPGIVKRFVTLPPAANRLMLFLLVAAAQLLTEIVAAAQAGRAYDLILAVFQIFVAYWVAEGAYQKIYKAPLTVTPTEDATTVPLEPGTGDLSPAVVTLAVEPAPVTLASKIAGQ